MFCFKCGSEIPEESEFCMKCGTKITLGNQKSDIEIVSENKKQTFAQKLLYGNSGATSYSEYKQKISDGEFAPTQKQKTEKQIIEKPLSRHQRIKRNKKNAVACCPKCGSTSLSANKKGFGIGKAVVGSAIIGPIGLVAGNKGAKKVRITCLNCGHQWKP